MVEIKNIDVPVLFESKCGNIMLIRFDDRNVEILIRTKFKTRDTGEERIGWGSTPMYYSTMSSALRKILDLKLMQDMEDKKNISEILENLRTLTSDFQKAIRKQKEFLG